MEGRVDTTLGALAILAADDHAINRDFLRLALAERVGELEIVADGREAVRACAEREFDIVLMDLHMPDVDGLSAWERIRRLSRRAGVERQPRVLALTADSRPGQSERLRAHGFHGVVHKPVTIEALVKALAAVAADETAFVEPADAGSEPAALVDHAQAERAAGGVEQAAELQRALARELADNIDALDALIANGHNLAAADRLHQWSGAAGYAGARRFSEATARLERCLRAGLNSSPGSLYFEWRRTLAGTLAALEQHPG